MSALALFYGNSYIDSNVCKDEHSLASLFALYDTLNDDDTDIRDLGAMTVSKMVGKSLVPLASRLELANLIRSLHQKSSIYAWIMVRRMTGQCSLENVDIDQRQISSAAEQLELAMRTDDSLFIEEDQNLFVDETKEAELWSKTFVSANTECGDDIKYSTAWKLPCTLLGEWVLNGLKTLAKLLDRPDGPLGWASKPTVFAICMTIILSASSILQGREIFDERVVNDIEVALKDFVALGRQGRLHERLLFEAEGIRK